MKWTKYIPIGKFFKEMVIEFPSGKSQFLYIVLPITFVICICINFMSPVKLMVTVSLVGLGYMIIFDGIVALVGEVSSLLKYSFFWKWGEPREYLLFLKYQVFQNQFAVRE